MTAGWYSAIRCVMIGGTKARFSPTKGRETCLASSEILHHDEDWSSTQLKRANPLIEKTWASSESNYLGKLHGIEPIELYERSQRRIWRSLPINEQFCRGKSQFRRLWKQTVVFVIRFNAQCYSFMQLRTNKMDFFIRSPLSLSSSTSPFLPSSTSVYKGNWTVYARSISKRKNNHVGLQHVLSGNHA